MSTYRTLLLSLLSFVTLGGWALAQSTSEKPAESPPKNELAETEFPKSWEGHWKGEAESISDDSRQKFNMELIVKPTETPNEYQWTLIYDGPAGRQERPFKLLVVNAEKHEYSIDEQNGIVLSAKLLNNTLFTHFSISGVRLVTRSKLVKMAGGEDVIEQEIVSFDESDKRETGNQDGAPTVSTWLAINLQRAQLKRVSK